MPCSRLSTTSSAKSAPVDIAAARMSSCTGLPSQTPQRALGVRRCARASCSTSTVSSPASPGVTIFGPPEKPAKKCGSTKPVVMRTSACTHSVHSHTGTPSPNSPIHVSVLASRASWLTTRTVSTSSSPSMARSSASVLPRWVPVATSTTTSSSRTTPSSSSSTARHHELARLRAGRVADRDGDRLPGPRPARAAGVRRRARAGPTAGPRPGRRPSAPTAARPRSCARTAARPSDRSCRTRGARPAPRPVGLRCPVPCPSALRLSPVPTVGHRRCAAAGPREQPVAAAFGSA